MNGGPARMDLWDHKPKMNEMFDKITNVQQSGSMAKDATVNTTVTKDSVLLSVLFNFLPIVALVIILLFFMSQAQGGGGFSERTVFEIPKVDRRSLPRIEPAQGVDQGRVIGAAFHFVERVTRRGCPPAQQ